MKAGFWRRLFCDIMGHKPIIDPEWIKTIPPPPRIPTICVCCGHREEDILDPIRRSAAKLAEIEAALRGN